MAGPNGGPPRRSHTKSRKGCDTCKKRHIRCDESFPQCKNCTKHKVRCPYNDLTVTEDRCPGSPGQPDLLWTADVRQAVQMWKHEGVFPIQDWPAGLRTPDPARHSAQSLRLIYHLASTYWDLRNLGANDLTLWTRHIPSLIDVASSHDYVMDALLAFSAMQISEVSRCPAAANLSSEHHLAAISGLNLAINGWSRETSDAILAANFVLSWQAKDWSNWSYFIGGTRMMISSMKEWKFDSKFLDLIDENGMASSPAPPSPKPETARFSVEDDLMVDQTLTHLQRLESTLKASKDAAMKDKAKEIQQLSNFLKGARKIGPKQSIEEQFDRLRDLRTWLFELPVTLLRNSGCQPNRLAVIAHYYTVALLMERLFPHMGGVYFGSMTIRPLHYIAQMLGQQQDSLPEPLSHMANVARDVSLAAVADFTMRNDWFMLTPHTPSYSPSPYYPETNFSTSEVCLQGLGFTGPNAVYGTPSFSYSQNSLPVNSSYSPVNGGSPQSMHSPYTGHGFLGVPSPNLGRAWSPVSSNFEDGQCFDGDVFLEPEFISHAPFHGRSLSAGHVYSDNRNHLVPAFASSELSM